MKKTTTREIGIITKKKALLDVLERLMNTIDSIENETTTEYRVVGKSEEQMTNWKTGELMWEDEEKTVPKMRDEYGYVDLTEDEMTDENLATLEAIKVVKEVLEKLV
jgi:hypothetical protein